MTIQLTRRCRAAPNSYITPSSIVNHIAAQVAHAFIQRFVRLLIHPSTGLESLFEFRRIVPNRERPIYTSKFTQNQPRRLQRADQTYHIDDLPRPAFNVQPSRLLSINGLTTIPFFAVNHAVKHSYSIRAHGHVSASSESINEI